MNVSPDRRKYDPTLYYRWLVGILLTIIGIESGLLWALPRVAVLNERVTTLQSNYSRLNRTLTIHLQGPMGPPRPTSIPGSPSTTPSP